MYRDILSRVEGIDIFPLIGLVIFFTFFVALLVWVVRLSRTYIATMENMPLDAPDGPPATTVLAAASGQQEGSGGPSPAGNSASHVRNAIFDVKPINRNPE